MTAKFKITSKFLNSTKTCVKNHVQVINMFRLIFNDDERMNNLRQYLAKTEIGDQNFEIISPAGSITISRIK